MRTVLFELDGQEYHLCLNGAALYDIYEKYGMEEPILSHIQGAEKESFQAVCWMLAKLAEQGELVRRYQGHDKGPMGTEHRFRATLAPRDVIRAKGAIEETVQQGLRREEPGETGPVDKGLQKLAMEEKKTAPAPTGAGTCRRSRSFWACLFGRGCCCAQDGCVT